MVSKEPNDEAIPLKHNELFDIVKNPFSQFFGRLLFGTESDYRKYFNENNILWMHAKGSSCHGSTENDGKFAIRSEVISADFSLIVAFGREARQVFFKRRVNFDIVSDLFKNGPEKVENIKEFLTPRLINSDFLNNDTYIVNLPHASGFAQPEWMKYPLEYSSCLQQTQKIVFNLSKG